MHRRIAYRCTYVDAAVYRNGYAKERYRIIFKTEMSKATTKRGNMKWARIYS